MNHPANREPSDDDRLPDRIRLLMDLRNRGIHDTAVLSAMEQIPRSLFVDEPFSAHAYEDSALPIACGQTISQPSIVAAMTEALELNPQLRVLEIGTGSGYQTSVLSRLARRVYTVERHRELLAQAEVRFQALRLTNIVTKCADGSKGWKEAAPFERILVTAAAAEIPQALMGQLASGGILVMPVGENGGQQLLKVIKHDDGTLTREELMPVRFVPLIAK